MRPKTRSGRIASQDERELGQFIELMLANNVRAYGEIGARDGDTFYAVMKALGPKARGVALDYPGGAWGRPTSRSSLVDCIRQLEREGFASASCMFGDSKTAATVRQFRGRGPYDAILIDGDHRIEGVTSDWTNYRMMASLVAFHDIVGFGQHDKRGREVQVPQLWRSIVESGMWRTHEIIASGSRMGIGIVWTGECKLAA